MIIARPNAPIHLLLAEDNPGDARLIRELLRETHPEVFDIELVTRLDAAIDRMAVGDVDALLLDLGLPDSQGLDTFRRAQREAGSQAIVVISGRDDEEFALEAVRAGAQDYLVKGRIQQQLLVRVIRYAIERKKLVEALRASELKLRRLVDANLMGVCFWRADGQITDANDEFLRIADATREELARGALDWRELTPERCLHVLEDAQRGPAGSGIVPPVERELCRRDGTRVPVVFGAASSHPAHAEGVAFVLDRSERSRLEHQLRQNQRIEAIGRLAGGVAHDFNNLLTIILGEVELAATAQHQPGQVEAALREIRAAGERAAGLTRQLLLFSRRQTAHLAVFAVQEVVLGLQSMLARLIGEDIRLEWVPTCSSDVVRMDRGQLEQIVMNLVVNARDAMPHGGVVTIGVRAEELGAGVVAAPPDLRPGPYVVLTVADTGTGIPEEVREHVFEPFFTTKEVGHGTGLGLATCHGIAREADGGIQIATTGPVGTTVEVWLPNFPGPPTPPPTVHPATDGAAQTGTILVIEDDDALRRIAEKILHNAGYAVLSASTGPGAREVVREHGAEIALVFSDVVLRDASGPALVADIRTMVPNLKVLFTSGYSEGPGLRSLLQEGGVPFLQKPYRPVELVAAVREVLGQG